MNWEALGALGEIVGATAVIGSLVYLAIQLRQNTRQLKLHGVQATATIADSNFRMVHEQHMAVLGNDPSFVIALARTKPEELDLQQRIILDAYHQSTFMTLGHRKLMADFGVSDSLWKDNVPMFAAIYAYPAGREWWVRKRDQVDPELRAIFDAVLAQAEVVTPRLEPYSSPGEAGGSNDA